MTQMSTHNRTGRAFGWGEAGRDVLLNQGVPRGLLRAVAVVKNRGTARPPLGLLANGLNATIPK